MHKYSGRTSQGTSIALLPADSGGVMYIPPFRYDEHGIRLMAAKQEAGRVLLTLWVVLPEGT